MNFKPMNPPFQNPGQVETIAYFSMEIALDPAMPTYCGGLGMLAGDTIRSAADLKVPMIVSVLVTIFIAPCLFCAVEEWKWKRARRT